MITGRCGGLVFQNSLTYSHFNAVIVEGENPDAVPKSYLIEFGKPQKRRVFASATPADDRRLWIAERKGVARIRANRSLILGR